MKVPKLYCSDDDKREYPDEKNEKKGKIEKKWKMNMNCKEWEQ
jgi:hypothetical protein